MLRTFSLVISAVIAAGGSAVAAPEDCRKVRMAEPGWTDLALTTAVASRLLQGLGYEPQSQVLGITVIYESMTNGDLDAFLGYWDPAMNVYFDPYREKGTIETIHQNLEGAKFTFAVPSYVYEGGVKDFSDLAGHAEKFGRKMYGMEAGSNEIMLGVTRDPELGLQDWTVVESSEQGMLAQVKRAVTRGQWIVFAGWAPHPMNNEFDLEYLTGGDEFYGPDFGGATVHTQVHAGYVEACPNLGRLLRQLTFDIPFENTGMGYILNDGMSEAAAAEKLLKESPHKLDDWLEGVETFEGEDGLAAVRESLGL